MPYWIPLQKPLHLMIDLLRSIQGYHSGAFDRGIMTFH